MITDADLQFHTPADVRHDWAETYYFDLPLPDAGIHGFVYFVFRAGVGATASDIQFWDTSSLAPHDALYIDVQNHLPLPDRMDDFTLPNGAGLRATSPTDYRVDYVGMDGTEVHVDYAGLTIPYDIHDPDIDPLAHVDPERRVADSGFGTAYASHFDLAARATGHVVVRGVRHEVDRVVTMDHSWGPRPEHHMPPMTWINANFEDLQLHAILKFTPGAPGTEHEFAHGYAVVDGELRGGVGGSLRVERDGILGTAYELTVEDRTGTTHRLTGRPIVNRVWYSYACCPAAVAMIEWRTEDGRVGCGTSMESYPLDGLTGGALDRARAAAASA